MSARDRVLERATTTLLARVGRVAENDLAVQTPSLEREDLAAIVDDAMRHNLVRAETIADCARKFQHTVGEFLDNYRSLLTARSPEGGGTQALDDLAILTCHFALMIGFDCAMTDRLLRLSSRTRRGRRVRTAPESPANSLKKALREPSAKARLGSLLELEEVEVDGLFESLTQQASRRVTRQILILPQQSQGQVPPAQNKRSLPTRATKPTEKADVVDEAVLLGITQPKLTEGDGMAEARKPAMLSKIANEKTDEVDEFEALSGLMKSKMARRR